MDEVPLAIFVVAAWMASIIPSGEKFADSAEVSAGSDVAGAPVAAIDVSEWERLDSDRPELSAWMSLTKAAAP